MYPPERQKGSRKVRQVTDGMSGVLHEAIAHACTNIIMGLTQRYDAEEVLDSNPRIFRNKMDEYMLRIVDLASQRRGRCRHLPATRSC
jgi:hypothetical protein